MIARTLQWTGVTAVLGLVGLSVFALSIVKDRIHVTVQNASVAESPDPLVLVRDDLRQLHDDLDAITRTVGKNLEVVANRLEEQSRNQSQLVAGVAMARQSLRSIQTDLTREGLTTITEKLTAVELRLRSFEEEKLATVGQGTSPPSRTPERSEKAGQQGQPQPSHLPDPVHSTDKSESIAGPEAKGKVTSTTSTKPKERKRSGFLAFDLPSRGFRFDKRQSFRILPSLSRVGFDAKSTLHDFSGVTSQITGQFVANLAMPSRAWTGRIECDANALRTGVDGRDEGLREYLLTKAHPRIRFEIQGFRQDSVDVAKQRTAGVVTGRISIRGKTRALEMPVKISVDESRRVTIKGQAALKLTDYEVPVPSQLGMISMEDEVRIWIALRARSTGEATHDR